MTSLAKISSVSKSSGRLKAMEGLRAYAVFVVFLTHYALTLSRHLKGGFLQFNPIGNTGIHEWFFHYLHSSVYGLDMGFKEWFFYYIRSSAYGVDLFFLISGFLISGLISKPNFSFSTFLAHRIFRIYPALVASLFISLAYLIAFKGGHFWLNGLIGNILLLNGIPGSGFPPINSVTWSLFFEFAFYIITPFLFLLSTKNGETNLWKLSFLSILIILPFLAISGTYMRFFMFLAGIWLHKMPRERLDVLIEMIPEYGVVALYILATTIFLFTNNWIIFIPIYIFPCFAMVNCVINGRGTLNQIFSLQPLRYLGNISFSFYLWHYLTLKMVDGFLTAWSVNSFGLYSISLFMASFLISLALSDLSFRLLEKPYFNNKAKFDTILRKLKLAPVTH